jgi:hypothetical protein
VSEHDQVPADAAVVPSELPLSNSSTVEPVSAVSDSVSA